MDRVFVVRNVRTGGYVHDNNGRIAVYWNPKMARRVANEESRRRYTTWGSSKDCSDNYEVLELDPEQGIVVYSTKME